MGSTTETETKTESPFTSVDMVNEETTEFTTTILDETEGQFAEEKDEAILKNEFETTTKMQETTSPEIKDISKTMKKKILTMNWKILSQKPQQKFHMKLKLPLTIRTMLKTDLNQKAQQ